jgi:hypothetical protein
MLIPRRSVAALIADRMAGARCRGPGVKRWCTKIRSWVFVGMLEGKMESLWVDSITESRLDVGELGVNAPGKLIGGAKGVDG